VRRRRAARRRCTRDADHSQEFSRSFSAVPSVHHTPPPLPTQPVSWATLALVVAAGAGVVIYNNVAREKKKTEG
jgi:hypothetical protein